ncbi:MAG: molybdopterin dinucleotide binding domain-containing protein [Syntrophobacteraceae bacterium]|nr:hypothetical protein [Desulfobacteraceae bacterium]
MGVTRREFIQIAGMAAGGGLGACGLLLAVPAVDALAGKAETRVAGNCGMCRWACGFLATVKDGRVVGLAPTDGHPPLHGFFGENEVWINENRAEELGIRHGAYVVLVNQDGVAGHRVRARVTRRIRPDCVCMVRGFRPPSGELPIADGKGADDRGLITRYTVDPICGSPGMRVNFVRIVREA